MLASCSLWASGPGDYPGTQPFYRKREQKGSELGVDS